MSKNRGIFESFLNQAPDTDSPFAVVPEPAAPAEAPRRDSPFSVDSPFQIAEPADNFGFEAHAKTFHVSPFEAAPSATSTSPFHAPAEQPAQSQQTARSPIDSPFAMKETHEPSSSKQTPIPDFNTWQKTPAAAIPAEPAFSQSPGQQPPASSPAAFTPAPVVIERVTAPVDNPHSDSFSIRQLELRAIFGMDREMSPDEILQRSRALPGMKTVKRVSPQDMAAIESVRNLLPNLGFGSGGLKLYAGSVPIEFIREGPVMLAVQTDGVFAPGVREALILVARELGRIS